MINLNSYNHLVEYYIISKKNKDKTKTNIKKSNAIFSAQISKTFNDTKKRTVDIGIQLIIYYNKKHFFRELKIYLYHNKNTVCKVKADQILYLNLRKKALRGKFILYNLQEYYHRFMRIYFCS